MTNEQTGIFEGLIGRDGAKAVLRSALRSGDVHVALDGPSESGKSVALLSIEEAVPGAEYKDASGFTETKLRGVLKKNPPILLLDEFDDMKRDAYSALATSLEQGRVTKDVTGDSYDKEIDTQVIVSLNKYDKLPSHIQSRFSVRVEFDQYDRDEYLDVAEVLLQETTDWIEDAETAREAAGVVADVLGTHSIRSARDVTALANGPDSVRSLAQALCDPDAKVDSEPITPDEVAVVNGSSGVRRRTMAKGASRIIKNMLQDLTDDEIREVIRECEAAMDGTDQQDIETVQDEPPVNEDGEFDPDFENVSIMDQTFYMDALPQENDPMTGEPLPVGVVEDGIELHFTENDRQAVEEHMADLWETDLDNFLFTTDESEFEQTDEKKTYDIWRATDQGEDEPFSQPNFDPTELMMQLDEVVEDELIVVLKAEPIA